MYSEHHLFLKGKGGHKVSVGGRGEGNLANALSVQWLRMQTQREARQEDRLLQLPIDCIHSLTLAPQCPASY